MRDSQQDPVVQRMDAKVTSTQDVCRTHHEEKAKTSKNAISMKFQTCPVATLTSSDLLELREADRFAFQAHVGPSAD